MEVPITSATASGYDLAIASHKATSILILTIYSIQQFQGNVQQLLQDLYAKASVASDGVTSPIY